MTIFKHKQAGFTLVEVLVSITILLMVIVGPMKIIARSVNSTNFASQESTAWFLAQEGLELAQKGRDDLVLGEFKSAAIPANNGVGTTQPFTNFLTKYNTCINGSAGCDLTIISNAASPAITVTDCSLANNPCALVYDTAGIRDKYFHVSGALSATQTLSPFKRVITMSSVPGTDGLVREIKVTSTVTWRTGSLISDQNVVVTTYLFNIYDTN